MKNKRIRELFFLSYNISVIIPIHNNEEHLHTSINSVINQSFPFKNIELILVDDVSTDSSKEIIKEYQNKYSNVKAIFLKENLRPGFARNVGIEHTDSDYMMFLDADDEYPLDVCETLYKKIINEEDVNAIYSNHVLRTRGKEFIGLVREEPYNKICPHGSLENFTYNFPIWGAIYETSFIKEKNIRCSKNMEDIYFNLQVFLEADCIICLNDYYGYYYNVFDVDKIETITNKHSKETFLNYYLDGATFIVNMLKEKYPNNLKFIGNEFIRILLMFFLQCKMDFKTREEIIKKIYDYEQLYDYDIKPEQKWLAILNYFILNKNFKIATIISALVYSFLSIKIFEKISRKLILRQVEIS